MVVHLLHVVLQFSAHCHRVEVELLFLFFFVLIAKQLSESLCSILTLLPLNVFFLGLLPFQSFMPLGLLLEVESSFLSLDVHVVLPWLKLIFVITFTLRIVLEGVFFALPTLSFLHNNLCKVVFFRIVLVG